MKNGNVLPISAINISSIMRYQEIARKSMILVLTVNEKHYPVIMLKATTKFSDKPPAMIETIDLLPVADSVIDYDSGVRLRLKDTKVPSIKVTGARVSNKVLPFGRNSVYKCSVKLAKKCTSDVIHIPDDAAIQLGVLVNDKEVRTMDDAILRAECRNPAFVYIDWTSKSIDYNKSLMVNEYACRRERIKSSNIYNTSVHVKNKEEKINDDEGDS